MRKKILQLIPIFAVGGAETLATQYYENISAKDWEMFLASGVEDGPLRARVTDQSRVFVGSRQKMGGRFGAWRQLVRFVKKEKFDLIHSHLLSSDFFAYWYKTCVNKKVIWVSTQHNLEKFSPLWKRVIWRIILPHANKVTAVSPQVYDYVHKYFGVKKDKLILACNGVEIKKWHNDAPVLSKKKLRLAIIGRLEKQKGHKFLWRALESLSRDIDWQLDVFGEGSLKEKLKKLAKRLDIDRHIVWHGAVADLPSRLVDIDVVVQPSLWEGLCLVLVEATAAGRVVVASRAAGKGIIQSGINGFLFDDKNFRQLAKMIFLVHKERTHAQKIAGQARMDARNYSLDKNLLAMKTIYKELL